MFILGAFGLFFCIALHGILISLVLVIMSLIAIYLGVYAIIRRKKEPMKYENNKLTFFKRGSIVEVSKQNIEKIFYNTSGLGKKVTILTKDKNEIHIPVVYGLAELAKKLNKDLNLT
jgi:hypothetical protein